MRVIKKRRPDLRKIRPTKSYATIREWLAAGMPAMDDQQPAMILGWAARSWLKAKWDERRHESGPLHIYCFGCKKPQLLEPHSISAHPYKDGFAKIKARCAVCGSAMYRAMAGDETVTFQAPACGTKKRDSLGTIVRALVPHMKRTQRQERALRC